MPIVGQPDLHLVVLIDADQVGDAFGLPEKIGHTKRKLVVRSSAMPSPFRIDAHYPAACPKGWMLV